MVDVRARQLTGMIAAAALSQNYPYHIASHKPLAQKRAVSLFFKGISFLFGGDIEFSLFASFGPEFKTDRLLQPNVEHSDLQFPTFVYWNFTPAHYVT